MKKLSKVNIDQIVGPAVFLILILYILAYGLLHFGGITFGPLTNDYLIILLPIWLIDGCKSTIESLAPKRHYFTSEEDISKVTVIIACKDGQAVLGNTLRELRRKFPPKQIIVASNGSTDMTTAIARRYHVVCLDYKEALGKVRAINQALEYVNTPYVLLIDDDTLLGGARIPTGLLDDGYSAVAFRVFVKETTWVSRLQMHEYRKSSDIGKRYHNKRGSVQNISGAIGLFPLPELVRQLKFHTGEFSGEDLQRTLLIHLANSGKGVVLARSVVITEAPDTLVKLFKQRIYGWYPGLYANFGNYLKIIFSRRLPWVLKFDALYNCFFVMILDFLRLLSLPILFFYPWYFILTYVAYLLFELVPYVRSGAVEPLWVILVYPLYGIFGLLTRVIACAILAYRRLIAKFGALVWVDDYRGAPKHLKVKSLLLTTGIVSVILLLNVIINFSTIFTNFTLSQLFIR